MSEKIKNQLSQESKYWLDAPPELWQLWTVVTRKRGGKYQERDMTPEEKKKWKTSKKKTK